MAQQTINIGASPNDGTGTPLRTAFQYTNSNFSELYTATGPSGNNIVVPGSATITGDLTVDTSTLKVDSANNRVGIGTASPSYDLEIAGAVRSSLAIRGNFAGGTDIAHLRFINANGSVVGDIYAQNTNGGASDSAYLSFNTVSSGTSAERYRIGSDGVATWSNVGGVAGTAMTLNSTGLGVGATPSTYKLEIGNGGSDTRALFNPNNAFAIGVKNGSNQLGGWIGSAGNNILTFSGNDGTMKVTIDNPGNVGVGVTPSAWGSITALEFKNGVSVGGWSASSSPQLFLTTNSYYNGTNFIYKNSTVATYYTQDAGAHKWYNAPSGTAGNAITFTQAMTLTAAGSLVLGAAAVATTATDGFLYIPGCAGTPTGTPTAQTGRVPLVVDTTNNKLYFYSGGSWVAAN